MVGAGVGAKVGFPDGRSDGAIERNSAQHSS